MRSPPRVKEQWDALLQTLETHSDYINAVVFSPDGKMLASGSEDSTIQLWDAATGMTLEILKGHSGPIHALAFSWDIKLLASGASGDGTVLLWDTATGAKMQSLKGHSYHGVDTVAFSTKDLSLATASDSIVRLWNPITGELLRVFDSFGVFHHMAFSVDGELLVASEYTPFVVWRVVGEVMQPTPFGSTEKVYRVAFSPDGTRLATACDETMVILWDITTSSALRTFKLIADEWGLCVAFSADSYLLAVASSGGILLYNAISGILLHTIRYQLQVGNCVTFSPDCKQLAVASGPCIRLWDLTLAGAPESLDGLPLEIHTLRFSPDGRVLASASPLDGAVLLWDTATAAIRHELCGHPTSSVVAFSPSGELFGSIFLNTIEVWNTAEGTLLLRTREGPGGRLHGMENVAFSPNNKQFVTTSLDETLKLWDVSTGAVLKTLSLKPHYADAVAFSPDGSRLAFGLNNNLIRVLNISTGDVMQMGRGHEAHISAVAVSSNNKQLASASVDNTIKLWDTFSGQVLHSLEVDSSRIETLSFSSDQTVLHTDKGPFRITFSPNGAATLGIDPSGGMYVRGQWLSRGNQNMLWLPPEYRPTRTAVWGDIVALGHDAGRVSIFEFNF